MFRVVRLRQGADEGIILLDRHHSPNLAPVLELPFRLGVGLALVDGRQDGGLTIRGSLVLDGARDLPFRPERRELVIIDSREALGLRRQGVEERAHLEGGQGRHRFLNAAEAFDFKFVGAPALRGGAGARGSSWRWV